MTAAAAAGTDLHLSKLEVLGQVSDRARALEQYQVRDTRHRDGTGRPGEQLLAETIRNVVQDLRDVGLDTWSDELRAAALAAAAETDWPQLRERLLVVAATAVNWIVEGDRRA